MARSLCSRNRPAVSPDPVFPALQHQHLVSTHKERKTKTLGTKRPLGAWARGTEGGLSGSVRVQDGDAQGPSIRLGAQERWLQVSPEAPGRGQDRPG